MENRDVLLNVKNLTKKFTINKKTTLTAVDNVTLTIRKGSTFGLVGESGCGKSTLGRCILRLIEPSAGKIIYGGVDISALKGRELRKARANMQIVFQNPYSSLNPRMNVLDIIKAPLDAFKIGTTRERYERVRELMTMVGLDEKYLYRYPHEFSGGQRQRIGIARALILNPGFVLCDEPVSALDVSVRSQILNLMKVLQQRMGVTYLFISHDLSVVKHISDQIAVMYLGKIVEIADVDQIYDTPLHPYTQALISAIPIPDISVQKERILLQGDIPSPINLPTGCRFNTRCRFATRRCREEEPMLQECERGHQVSCYLYQKDQQ